MTTPTTVELTPRPMWHRVLAAIALAFLLFMMFYITKTTLRSFAENYGTAFEAQARGAAITDGEEAGEHVLETVRQVGDAL